MQKLRKGMALLLAVLLCVGVLPLSGVAHAESLPEETTLEETSQKEETKVEEATPVVAESVAPEAAPSDDDKEAAKDNSAVSDETVSDAENESEDYEAAADKEESSDVLGEGESEDKESESEDEPVALSDKVLTATVDGISVTISGKLPENAEIQAVSVPLNLAQEMLDTLDGRENDEKVREAVFALDVSILSDGEKFQPSDFGESVIVTIHNANAEDDPLELLHVKEDVTDGAGSLDVNAMQAAVDAAANGTVETETLATTESGNAVSFNMDSFSLLIASAPRRAPGQANNVETWGELVAAINAIPANGSGEITITADLSSTSSITISAGKTVTIKAAGEAKTINLQGANSFNITGANVTFENLNITKTSGTDSPDLYVYGVSTLTLRDVTLDGGGGGYTWAPIYGTGGTVANKTKIFIYDSTIKNGVTKGITLTGNTELYMENSVVSNNGTHGIQLNGGASATIDRSTISDNTEVGLNIIGSGTAKPSATITNSTIERNKGASFDWGSGGGIYADTATLTIESSEIKDNTALSSGYGGGIYAMNSTVSIRAVEIHDNTAGDHGGGIYAYDSTLTIESSKIKDNQTASINGNGGGIYASYSDVSIKGSGSEISGNTAGKSGGGICLSDSCTASIQDVEIHGNTADVGGGGIYFQPGADADLQLISGRIYQNTCSDLGGGIYINSGGAADIKNAVVYENSAKSQGGGIWACPTGIAQIYVTQGIASFDNTALEAGADLVLQQPNNQSADPFAYVGSRMLGGFLNQYVEDGGMVDNRFSNVGRGTDPNVPRSGDEWTDYDRGIAVAEGSVVLKNGVSKDAKDHAKNNAKVFIYDNTADCGGGIATNGGMKIGENDVTEITVEKKWEGGDPADKAEFTLHQVDAEENDVTLNDEVTVTDADGWEYTAKNLPTTYLDAGGNEQNFTYYFKEVSIPGWEAATEVSDDGKTYTITNTRKTFDLSGTKTWIDGGREHSNADEVTLTLTRISTAEGAVAETLEDVVPEWDENQYTYKKLETHDPNGNEYTYTVTEASVNGYTSTIEDYNITNRITGTVTISATKDWSDGDDQDGIRPEAVTVKILAGGTDTGKTLTLSEANGWADSAELDKYDDDGKEITYTLEEVSVEGYESVISGNVEDGFTVTNSHTPREEPPVEPEKINISVKKVWDDENDKDGIRPDHVTIHLLANGEKAETITLNKDNGWEYTFAGLVKTDGDGKEITYTVTEDAVKEYDSKITGDAASGYVVTNKHTPKPDKPTKPENPKPDAPKNTNVPRTGDDTNLALWFSLMGVALAGLAATAFTTRRRRTGKHSK